jgi:PAS fold
VGPEGMNLIESVFAGSSEMAARMRMLDWSATPLGPVEQWPHALRTSVRIVLNSGCAMSICWGTDFAFLYNDGYMQLIGTKHPSALGRPCREVIPEALDLVESIYDGVVRDGKASFLGDLPSPVIRSNYLEDCYFTNLISPLPDDSGNVGGILATVLETTERVLEERRRHLLSDLASRAAGARTEQEVWRVSAETLGENRQSLPFAYLYEYRPSEHQAHLVGASVETDEALHPPVIDCRSENLWRFDPALPKNGVLVELGSRASGVPVPNWPNTPKEACVVPIRLGEHIEALGFAASVNIPPNGIGPLDPNTKIGGYTLLNARIEWNNIEGSQFHAAAYVRNMLNKQYEVGGLGLGAAVGLDQVILGTPRMAALEVGLKF